jgi:hypothetical protein
LIGWRRAGRMPADLVSELRWIAEDRPARREAGHLVGGVVRAGRSRLCAG